MFHKLTEPLDPNPIHGPPTPAFTTPLGKAIGLLTLILLAGVLVFKCISVFNKEIVYLNYNVYESNDYRNRDSVVFDIAGAIGSINVFHQIDGRTQQVEMDDQFQHGLNASVLLFAVKDMKTHIYPLISCRSKSYSDTYCLPPDIKIPHEFQLQIASIDIRTCNQSISSKCNPQTGSYKIGISLYNTLINPITLEFQNITENNYMYREYKFEANKPIFVDIDMNEINIQSDESVFPSFWSKIKNNKTYQFDQNVEVLPGYGAFQISFSLSYKIFMYERRFKKLDAALAEVLAIAAVLGLLGRMTIGKYNVWAYKRDIVSKEVLRNSNIGEENRTKYSKWNILAYIKSVCNKKQDKQWQDQVYNRVVDPQNKHLRIDIKNLQKQNKKLFSLISQMQAQFQQLKKAKCRFCTISQHKDDQNIKSESMNMNIKHKKQGKKQRSKQKIRNQRQDEMSGDVNYQIGSINKVIGSSDHGHGYVDNIEKVQTRRRNKAVGTLKQNLL